MTITVNSPFTGRPVKIREKDVGRAVKDEDGGIFYVLPKSDGSGYYGAPTRHGGEKDETRAAEHEARLGGAHQTATQRSGAQITHARKRAGFLGKIKLLVILAIVAALAWAVFLGPLKGVLDGLLGGE